jgi:hypothetical protein
MLYSSCKTYYVRLVTILVAQRPLSIWYYAHVISNNKGSKASLLFDIRAFKEKH